MWVDAHLNYSRSLLCNSQFVSVILENKTQIQTQMERGKRDGEGDIKRSGWYYVTPPPNQSGVSPSVNTNKEIDYFLKHKYIL